MVLPWDMSPYLLEYHQGQESHLTVDALLLPQHKSLQEQWLCAGTL